MTDRNRQDLVALWRGRLADVKLRLDFVHAHLKEIQRDFPPGDADGEFAVRQALHAENAALAEYNHVLRIFTELVHDGKIPDENEWPRRKNVSGD